MGDCEPHDKNVVGKQILDNDRASVMAIPIRKTALSVGQTGAEHRARFHGIELGLGNHRDSSCGGPAVAYVGVGRARGVLDVLGSRINPHLVATSLASSDVD